MHSGFEDRADGRGYSWLVCAAGVDDTQGEVGPSREN